MQPLRTIGQHIDSLAFKNPIAPFYARRFRAMLEGEAYGHSPERCAGNEEDPSLRGEAVAGTAHRHGFPPALPGLRPGGDDAPVQGGKKHPRRVPGGETGGQAARVKSLRRDVGQPRPVRLENLGPREERGSLFTYGTGS